MTLQILLPVLYSGITRTLPSTQKEKSRMFEKTKTALQAPAHIRTNSEIAVYLLVGIAAISLLTFIAVIATRSSQNAH